MRPFGSQELLEKRRRRAVKLLEKGFSLHEVARKLNCDASSVLRWRNAYRKSGAKGLEPKPVPGRPTKLMERQKKWLIEILLKGAMRNGYRTELWTTARIAEVIEKNFGVTYHRDHIGRLVSGLGWSYQKPDKRALQRDEKAIEKWKREKWPLIKKTLRGWAPISFS